MYMTYLKQHFEESKTMLTVDDQMKAATFTKKKQIMKLEDLIKNDEIKTWNQESEARHDIITTYNTEIQRIQGTPEYKTLEGMKNMAKAIYLYRKTLTHVKRAIKKGNKTLNDINPDEKIFDMSSKPELKAETFQKYRDFLKNLPTSDRYNAGLDSKKTVISNKIQAGTDMSEWTKSTFLKNEATKEVKDLLLCEVLWLMTNYGIHKTKRAKKKP